MDLLLSTGTLILVLLIFFRFISTSTNPNGENELYFHVTWEVNYDITIMILTLLCDLFDFNVEVATEVEGA